MFKKGDRVEILDEFKDDGDETLAWVVVGDEEKGRVDIMPDNLDLDFKPVYTVKTEWIAAYQEKSLSDNGPG